MKKKLAILLSGLLAASAVAVTTAAVITTHADSVPLLDEESSMMNARELPPAVIVRPADATTIDLEASSPMSRDEAARGSVEVETQTPSPEITWYDPYRLGDVGGIS